MPGHRTLRLHEYRSHGGCDQVRAARKEPWSEATVPSAEEVSSLAWLVLGEEAVEHPARGAEHRVFCLLGVEPANVSKHEHRFGPPDEGERVDELVDGYVGQFVAEWLDDLGVVDHATSLTHWHAFVGRQPGLLVPTLKARSHQIPVRKLIVEHVPSDPLHDGVEPRARIVADLIDLPGVPIFDDLERGFLPEGLGA